LRPGNREVIVVNIDVAKTPKRPSYHHGDLRNALVAASLEAIAEHGVEGFTLREAARRAGVSPAAPYRHFADRDELLAAVAGECAERLGAELDEAMSKAPPDDAMALFRASGIAYVRFAVTHPAHFRVMQMPAVSERTPAATRAAVMAWKATAKNSLVEAQAAGALSDLPIDDILLAARCLTHGLAHLLVSGREDIGPVTPETAARMAEAITDVFGEGLRARVSGDGRKSASSTGRTASPGAGRSRRRSRSRSRS
jgi:AcrR family transcriptional regulator